MNVKNFKVIQISLFVGFIVTMLISILSATYYESSPVTGYENVVTGIDAIMITIDSLGVFGYLQGLIAPYLIYSFGIFISCIFTSMINK